MKLKRIAELRRLIANAKEEDTFLRVSIDTPAALNFFSEALYDGLPDALDAIERVHAVRPVKEHDNLLSRDDVIAAILGSAPQSWETAHEATSVYIANNNGAPVPQSLVRALLEEVRILQSNLDQFYAPIPGDDAEPRDDRDEDEIEYFE